MGRKGPNSLQNTAGKKSDSRIGSISRQIEHRTGHSKGKGQNQPSINQF